MPLKHKQNLILALTAILLFGFAIAANATQERAVTWEIVEDTPSGTYDPEANSDGDTTIQIYIEPQSWMSAYTLIHFPQCGMDPEVKGKPVKNLDEIIQNPDAKPQYNEQWVAPEPRYLICPTQSDNIAEYNYSASFVFKVDFRGTESTNLRVEITGEVYNVSELVWNLPIEGSRKIDKQARFYLYDSEVQQIASEAVGTLMPSAKVTITLFYKLDGGKLYFERGEFGEIFGEGEDDGSDPQEDDGFSLGDYDEVKDQMPVLLGEYRRDIKIPDDTNHDDHSRHQATLQEILNQGTQRRGDYICIREPYFQQARSGREAEREAGAISHTITGKLSVKWASDHSLHPAFGWWAEAWSFEKLFPKKLAEGWVQSNGRYTLQVDSSKNYKGGKMQVFFKAYNDYFAPMDQNDNKYKWHNPRKNSITANHDEGHRWADCDGGNANGLGELYQSAMFMWSNLYWAGGVNPVRTDPIKFYYPNTWYDCGDGSGTPWSCSSNGSPTIWLTASHGMNGRVVTHELAHQLQNEYWSNKHPKNSGGSHNGNSCYSTRLGMTMAEGFANFIPAWVGYQNRNVAEGGFTETLFSWSGYRDTEERTSPPNCTNGWENEYWGARLFWDLHDTRGDGDDGLHFTHMGGVINLYLGNPVANDGDAMDLRDLEDIYKGAASSGHEGIIEDIFDQNRM